MSVSAVKLLSGEFVKEALTQEVHRLLSLGYAREILDALAAAPQGRSARWIDVKVVGEEGSSKTAFVLLNRFLDAGWAIPKGPKGSRIWSITDKGRHALEYARQGDSFGRAGLVGEK